MGYVDEHLLPEERILHRTNLHPMIFVPGGVFVVLALPLLAVEDARPVGGGVLLIAAALLLQAIVKYSTSEFAITTSRLIVKIGWLGRRTIELQLGKVEGLAVEQPFLGRILDYGTLRVSGTGGTKELFRHIQSPLVFRKQIQQQAEICSVQNRGVAMPAGANPLMRSERPCPFCAENILAQATRCRFCGQTVTAMQARAETYR